MRDRAASPWSPTRAALAIAALGAAAALVTGCSSSTAAPAITERPVQLRAIPGGDLHKVVLSTEAVTRLGIHTEAIGTGGSPSPTPVHQAAPAKRKGTPAPTPSPTLTGAGERIPFAAVIYDPQGQSWAYLAEGARTFYRTPIVIDRIDGESALLKSGPPTGSALVTVGAPELLGAEYGVGAE